MAFKALLYVLFTVPCVCFATESPLPIPPLEVVANNHATMSSVGIGDTPEQWVGGGTLIESDNEVSVGRQATDSSILAEYSTSRNQTLSLRGENNGENAIGSSAAPEHSTSRNRGSSLGGRNNEENATEHSTTPEHSTSRSQTPSLRGEQGHLVLHDEFKNFLRKS